MKSKTVLITGANRGLGWVLLKAFADAGAEVHGAGRRYLDICDVVDMHSLIGMLKPDIFINNAAITADATVHKMTGEQWDDVIKTNLTGVFNGCRAVLPYMREKGWGRIVNIVSVVAHTGCYGAANYAASKAGVIGLTKSVALENARKGITCNAVALGFMGAGMCERLPDAVKEQVLKATPMGRFGTPEEAADAVLFLASDKASFITGEVLNVNGGYYL